MVYLLYTVLINAMRQRSKVSMVAVGSGTPKANSPLLRKKSDELLHASGVHVVRALKAANSLDSDTMTTTLF